VRLPVLTPRPNQTPIIEVVRLENSRTQAGSRTGPVGVSALDTSARIHEQPHISNHLPWIPPCELTAPAKTGPDAIRNKPAADAGLRLKFVALYPWSIANQGKIWIEGVYDNEKSGRCGS
jgi:hypothetical protein